MSYSHAYAGSFAINPAGTQIASIATALANVLKNNGIRAVSYLGDQVNPPVALIATETVIYHGAFSQYGGLADHMFTLFLILARTDDRSTFKALDGYMSNTGPTSLRAILETDQSLGGIAAGVIVMRAGPPVSLSVQGVEYVSCPFELHVHAE